MSRELYRVADLVFELKMPSDSECWKLTQPYKPFLVDSLSRGEQSLFSLSVVDQLVAPKVEEVLIRESSGGSDDGMTRLDVSRTSEGYYFEITPPYSPVHCAKLHFNIQTSSLEMELSGNKFQQHNVLNNALIVGYVLTATHYGTVLLHSSTVVKDGKAYMFLGKSGTGKSTHSRLWIESIGGCELLNDDHPIVRIMPSGEVLAFGSPWSGKTNCYKSLSAPVQAIVRIQQAPSNKIVRLSVAESYASLMASSSGMSWSEEFLASRARVLGNLLQRVANYRMECLPDSEAAWVCYEGVR